MLQPDPAAEGSAVKAVRWLVAWAFYYPAIYIGDLIDQRH